jgi:Xaa-Pro aminopeptidase
MTEKTPAEIERHGDGFDPEQAAISRDLTRAALLAAAASVRPGMVEADVRGLLDQALAAEGLERLWHASQVRLGPNTILPFGAEGRAHVLRGDDIFFLDIGPVFLGHESDMAETFCLGDPPAFGKARDDSKAVFEEVSSWWRARAPTGRELYGYAADRAAARGWLLQLEHCNGHRISKFPHSVIHKGVLGEFDAVPSPGRWILEIHLLSPDKSFGAFYEDVLS